MEQWEHEVFGHVTQPPTFKLDEKHRKQFEAAEAAVNAKLAKPPATHLHHEHEIAKPAISTRHRISGVHHNNPSELNLN